MTTQLVLTLYRTLFRKLKKNNNTQGLEVLKIYAKENKNLTNINKINVEIQLMIDKLIYINMKEERKIKNLKELDVCKYV
jgi:hypothetical protein